MFEKLTKLIRRANAAAGDEPVEGSTSPAPPPPSPSEAAASLSAAAGAEEPDLEVSAIDSAQLSQALPDPASAAESTPASPSPSS